VTPSHPDPGLASEAPPATIEDACIAASRWVVWRTIARGLAHGLANAAQMLALDPTPPRAREEAIERVALATARLAEAAHPGRPAPTLVPELLADVQAMQRLQSGFPSTELRIAVEGPLPPVDLPASDLAHALMVLVTRAKCAAGDEQARIQVRARASADGVEITIADEGRPIPPEARERAFDPLADPSGPTAGLAAARMLVRRAGGELRRDPPARFTLHAPAWRRAR